MFFIVKASQGYKSNWQKYQTNTLMVIGSWSKYSIHYATLPPAPPFFELKSIEVIYCHVPQVKKTCLFEILLFYFYWHWQRADCSLHFKKNKMCYANAYILPTQQMNLFLKKQAPTTF